LPGVVLPVDKLGVELVKKGLWTFIGYKKNYIVMLSRKRNTNPILDDMAKLFLEPSNLIATSIVKGNTVEEANIKSKKAMINNLRNVLSSKMRNKDEVVAYLLHDLNCQTVVGDPNAKL
jgi:hypothetical protein